MFNLLQRMASQADCQDEAWDLLLEFAAAEQVLTRHSSPNDNAAHNIFDMPAEAMLRCLIQDLEEGGDEQEWEVSQFGVGWPPDEPTFSPSDPDLSEEAPTARTEVLIRAIDDAADAADATEDFSELSDEEYDPDDPCSVRLHRSK
ncbi:MAG: hypothetical protein HRU17_06550 [Polyangiaceae bacterium]|nr:hypothetical protein [Polyangiaceae bacterium]